MNDAVKLQMRMRRSKTTTATNTNTNTNTNTTLISSNNNIIIIKSTTVTTQRVRSERRTRHDDSQFPTQRVNYDYHLSCCILYLLSSAHYYVSWSWLSHRPQ